MKVTIRDRETLQSIPPLKVKEYLRAHEWHEVPPTNENDAIWLKGQAEETVELFQPLNPTFRDYALRMTEVLQTLAETEGRSQLDILTDIQHISADTLHIMLEATDMQDSTLSLEQAVPLVSHTRNLLVAAACATLTPGSTWYDQPPAPVLDYLKQVKVGQTGRRASALTLISPVYPLVTVAEQAGALSNGDVPFPRQVIQTLMRAVAAVLAAVRQTEMLPDLHPFLEDVQSGVSANLCAALAGLLAGSAVPQVRIAITWSPLLASNKDIPTELVITPAAVPTLQAASNLLQQKNIPYPVQWRNEKHGNRNHTYLSPHPATLLP